MHGRSLRGESLGVSKRPHADGNLVLIFLYVARGPRVGTWGLHNCQSEAADLVFSAFSTETTSQVTTFHLCQ